MGGAGGGLARPEVPPGAQRDLVDALHALHHQAGWPSLRALAREAGCSHTTVAAVFSSPKVPSWGVLELVVEAMGGDVGEFRRLWLAASGPAAAPAARIAGRRTELATVRRHLESGTGLLLVTGEAGIGKTRLVDTAAGRDERQLFVARGAAVRCRPRCHCSRSPTFCARCTGWTRASGSRRASPGARRTCARHWVGCCPSSTMPRARRVSDDDWWRQRMFSAVGTTWAALPRSGRSRSLVEDLHWAEPTTLDLLEHLVTRDTSVPIVGTWRVDDQTLDRANVDWYHRVRRMRTTTTLPLALLSRVETRDELTLLTGQVPPDTLVDSLHRRTQGQPLFTEQLASHAD